MFDLQIEGEDVLLSAKTKLTLNKTFIDLGSIADRGLKFTNAFVLPPSKQTDRLLGFPSRLASNNQAFETNKKYILSDRTGILSRGDVVIKSYNEKDGTKIQLVEGYSFWANAGKKKLNDLICHDSDFIFNATNMNALKSKTSSIFLTALHAAAGSANTALVNYTYTRPCYYYFTLLDKMVTELGYSIDYGNVLQLTKLGNVGSLSNSSDFFVSDLKRRFEGVNAFGDLDVSTGSNEFSKAGNVSIVSGDLVNALYKTSYVIKGWAESIIDTQIVLTINGNVERVLIPKGRSFVNFRSDEVEIGSTCTFNAPTPITFEDVYIYSAINEADIFDIESSFDIDGYLVLADYNLPDQTYKELLKNMCKLFFLDIDVNENTKVAAFTYVPSKLSTNNALDLSSCVSRDFPTSGGMTYGQLNVMSFANDEDVSPNLGNAFFSTENKNAKELKSFLEIGHYSPSKEVTVSGENIIDVSIYDVAEVKRQSIKDRIVYFDEAGAFGFNAVFTPLSFQKTYSDHYFPVINATKRERSINLTAQINAHQMRMLGRKPVIFVSFLESHFLVTKLSGFDGKNFCKLNVVKFN